MDNLAKKVHFSLEVSIATFSFPATELPFPAITICKEHKFDVGEYVRAVFDNFQFSCPDNATCAESKLLREHYKKFTRYWPAEVRNKLMCVIKFASA